MCSQLQKRRHHLDKLNDHLQSIRHVLTANLGDPTQLPSPQEHQKIQQGHEFLLIAVSEGSPHDLENLRQTRRQHRIHPCHIIILLGLHTIFGSLVPAFWRSTARNDISGGFSIAQYILAVGVFVVGGMLVIHSRTCTCWSSSAETDGERLATADFENKLESLGLWDFKWQIFKSKLTFFKLGRACHWLVRFSTLIFTIGANLCLHHLPSGAHDQVTSGLTCLSPCPLLDMPL